jgi:DNA gyrase subunit A
MSDTNTPVYDLSTISAGVNYLKDGYIEYAQEVISGRALPDIYDGLKPVNRRILATLHNDKVTKNFMKSARISGNVLALHPHGDSSVYQAMVLMTQLNGSLAFPLIEGSGNFGGVYKSDPPAASRYTEARLHANTEEYFNEMNGIEMIPNFDSTMTEPVNLPVSFPAVLVNATTGIAVGFRSNVPSFNFIDVCNLVTEYIDKGQCTTVIEPDFVTGGYYIRNEKELRKLMQAGSGKIKLRARTINDGKKIIVTEVPYGKTIQKLIKQINDLSESSIRNAYDTDDFDHGAGFTIDCSSKARVDEALYTVLKNTDMQYTYTADITVVQNGVPKRMGVWGIIAEWVQWRRKVLTKEYQHQYDALQQSLREANAFMNIVNNYEKRMELVRIIADSGRANGKEYIRNNFTREEVPEDLIDFCASRSLPSYHDGGKLATIFTTGHLQLESLQKSIDNIDDVIKSQMTKLINRYGSVMKRRTEVTTKDYEFTEDSNGAEKVVDTSYCAYEFKGGFLKKLRVASGARDYEYFIEGTASDTLIAFDNRGRLLRVYCQDIPLSGTTVGTYLPTYFGLKETDDYKITWIGRMTGDELMLLYKDGNVGFVDTSEWTSNNRNVKVLQKGIAVSSAHLLGAVLDYIPQVLYVSDEEGNLAWADTQNIKHKDRTAKTRVFDLRHNKLLDSYLPTDYNHAMILVNNYGDYQNKLKELKDINDFRGDVNEFVDMM